MSEAIDVQLYLQKFQGKYPQGSEGDRQIRQDLTVPFIETTDEDVRATSLTDDQVNNWLHYAAWNLWDFILGRASEGESGLIPRQEYETVSFVQQWSIYPRFVRMLTDEIGVDGLLDLAKTSRREVGTKINVTRNWAASVCPILGRGIAVDLGYHDANSRRSAGACSTVPGEQDRASSRPAATRRRRSTPTCSGRWWTRPARSRATP
jgi:hypothetical protein